MMRTHLSLEVNPYAIRSRYWCDSLVRTKSMTQIYVMLCYVTVLAFGPRCSALAIENGANAEGQSVHVSLGGKES